MTDTLVCRCGAEFPLGNDVCHVCGSPTTAAMPKSNFANVRHNLYVGWVIGFAHRAGLKVIPMYDEGGNYTDRFVIDMNGRAITLVVPEPPDDWELTGFPDPECPGCGAKPALQIRGWWESSHDPECTWLNDPEAEPYS